MLRLLALLPILIALGCAEDDGDVILVGTLERTLVELVAPTSEPSSDMPASYFSMMW